jgi:predicted transcriptional regulator
VSPEFDDRLRTIAERDRKLLVEVLEEALEAYENSRNRQASR